MKHGIKLRKLQRTSSHRWALLRNLVSALLHHETIKTTLPKAKEAARMAEKIITLGKRGTDPARRAAMAYLMPSHSYSASSYSAPIPPPSPIAYPSSSSSSIPPSAIVENPESFRPPTTLMPKLFKTLADRYATRPGGYTRIHKFGKREGDNAPHAIISLVDGPRDVKFEMVARAVGRERLLASGFSSGSESGSSSLSPRKTPRAGPPGLNKGTEKDVALREYTKRNMEKVLKYRGERERNEFERKASEFGAMLAAEQRALGGARRRLPSDRPHSETARLPDQYVGRRTLAGERLVGTTAPTQTGLGLARGAMARIPWWKGGGGGKDRARA